MPAKAVRHRLLLQRLRRHLRRATPTKSSSSRTSCTMTDRWDARPNRFRRQSRRAVAHRRRRVTSRNRSANLNLNLASLAGRPHLNHATCATNRI